MKKHGKQKGVCTECRGWKSIFSYLISIGKGDGQQKNRINYYPDKRNRKNCTYQCTENKKYTQTVLSNCEADDKIWGLRTVNSTVHLKIKENPWGAAKVKLADPYIAICKTFADEAVTTDKQFRKSEQKKTNTKGQK